MKTLRNLLTLLALSLCLASAVAEEPQLRGDPEKASEAWTLIEEGALVIDVRTDEEVAAGSLEGAVHVPWDDTEALLAAIGEDRNRSVVMYCGSGGRVGRAIEALEAEGYDNLFNATGYDALVATQP